MILQKFLDGFTAVVLLLFFACLTLPKFYVFVWSEQRPFNGPRIFFGEPRAHGVTFP